MPINQIALDEESMAILDATASSAGFSREQVLKDAILHYSEYDRWFREKVKEGEDAFHEGRYISNEEAKRRSRKKLEAIISSREASA